MKRKISEILPEITSYKIEDWHIYLGKIDMEDLYTIIDYGYNSDFIRSLHKITQKEIDRRIMEDRDSKLNELGL